MPLAPGTKLGPYEIVSPLGAGGMGEVYRAKDTRLGRDVAVKVLPQHLAATPDLRARFEREAKTISSLNHPHICTLFDVGREGETDYLVMELVEGETLAARLTKGALTTEQVLKFGAEIADALDRAHRAGIVHRDLKPGNVMLTKSGTKLMDFGLARAVAERSASADFTQSPTMAQPLTAQGAIVGTFQYMAPEQLDGAEADARTDLWAMGCVLYEMATGRRAFEGKSQASLISSIMKDEPCAISELQPLAPATLDHVVRQCLAKDPEDRWQNAGDLRRELAWLATQGSSGATRGAGAAVGAAADAAAAAAAAAAAGAGAAPPKSARRPSWLVPLAILLAAAAGALAASMLRPHADNPALVRFGVSAPPGGSASEGAGNVTVSPDGRAIVFVGSDSTGLSGLWVRSLAEMTPRYLTGTTSASFPVWSPDSRQIAFFAEGKLRRVSAAGGEVDALCDASDGRGAAWGSRGVIVFAPSVASPIFAVDAAGGAVRPVTAIDSTQGELSHRFPSFLPDGRRFTYIVQASRSIQAKTDKVYVGSIDSTERTLLMESTRSPVYAEPGYLIHAQDDRLVAQRFDPTRLKLGKELIRLPEKAPATVNTDDRAASVSATGVLVIPAAASENARLAWFDRSGQIVGTLPLPPGNFANPVLSPDGKRVAVTMVASENAGDLWTIDLEHGGPTRLTFGPNFNRFPIWSPDGRRLVFQSNRSGPNDLYIKDADGAGAEMVLLASAMGWKLPTSWSSDGLTVVYDGVENDTGFDLWLMPVGGDGQPIAYLRTPANESRGVISPDCQWLAYTSNESGRFEIYVQSFPTPGTKYQVTTGGGEDPRWSADASELFYRNTAGFVCSVAVSRGDGLRFGASKKLFSLPRFDYDIAADGQRIIAVVPMNSSETLPISVVLNWAAGLTP